MSALQDTANMEKGFIAQLKQNSTSAFDNIYQMYAKRLYAYCLQFTKSPEDAEEIVQDVFVKLWQNRQRIRQEDTLRSLLFIMAKHYVISAFRTKINHPVYEQYVNYRQEMAVNDVCWHLEYHEFVKKLASALKTLPPTQREVIVLSKMKQLSNKEISQKLSLSEQTVKNSLSIGLKTLKKELDNMPLYILIFVKIIDIFGTIREIMRL